MVHDGPDPSWLNSFRFEADRFTVEVPTLDDVPSLARLSQGDNGKRMCAGLHWDGPRSTAEVADWVHSTTSEPFGTHGFHWVIRDSTGSVTDDPGVAIGAIVTRPTRQPGRATVGYYIGTEYWGQGVMGSVLSAFITFGFETLDFYKIEATVFHTNQRAIRLAEPVGMQREGTIRRAFFKRDTWIDYELFAISRGEPSIPSRP
jgi:RimJ/RimL family protein N-acetyltransferase